MRLSFGMQQKSRYIVETKLTTATLAGVDVRFGSDPRYVYC
jgi:hypothetical protein